MQLGRAVSLGDDLLASLVGCGKAAHDIARAHHNDPGSNGHTFGLERYQRATELAKTPLVEHGFQVIRRGAGLIARRDDVTIQFAVARGDDLTDPAAFDADSSPARRRAGQSNAGQLVLDGMPPLPCDGVVHLVWSGNPIDGQTAVHVGRLVSPSLVERLTWEVLFRIDHIAHQTSAGPRPVSVALPSYLDQPEPVLELAFVDVARSDEG